MTDPQHGPSRRTPRHEVRHRLIETAAQVFAEHGYTNTLLDEIAHRAGFTKGAVYSNFSSKRELFGAVLRDRSETEAETMLALIDDTPSAAADTVTRELARRITEDTNRGRLGLEFAAQALRDEATAEILTRMRRGQRERAAQLIRDVVERHGLRLATSADTAALLLHCLSNGLSMEHLADPEAVDTAAVAAALTELLVGITQTPRPGEGSTDTDEESS